MGNTASSEDSVKRLIEQGALTLPLGSQVEKLFHEDFDDDAQAILTPNTPTTPTLLLNDKKQNPRLWKDSLEVNKWAPVLPGASEKSYSGHASSRCTSAEYLSPQAALSITSTRRSSEVLPARHILSLRAKVGSDENTSGQDEHATKHSASLNSSAQTIYGPSWTSRNRAANPVLPNPVNSQSSLRLPEHISPQVAVSRIARRMAANALTSSNSNGSLPLSAPAPTKTDTTTSKHDSKLLSEAISTHDFQPPSFLPDPDPPAKSYPLQSLAAQGGAQRVLDQARERSRSRERERQRQRQRSTERLHHPAPIRAARLDELAKVISPRSSVDTPASWQQRITDRLSDEDVSDREKKRLSEVSMGQRMSWLEDSSAPNSDRED